MDAKCQRCPLTLAVCTTCGGSGNYNNDGYCTPCNSTGYICPKDKGFWQTG